MLGAARGEMLKKLNEKGKASRLDQQLRGAGSLALMGRLESDDPAPARAGPGTGTGAGTGGVTRPLRAGRAKGAASAAAMAASPPPRYRRVAA